MLAMAKMTPKALTLAKISLTFLINDLFS